MSTTQELKDEYGTYIRGLVASLRGGHYRGSGGLRAIAADLGVSEATVMAWQAGRTVPRYGARVRLEKLAVERGQVA
jgi:hypothetical protein